MKRTEVRIPLSQIHNLLSTPVSCYACDGDIITIPPTPIWNTLWEEKQGLDIYYIVDKIPDTSLRLNFILAFPPMVGRGGKEVRSLFLADMTRCYPMGDT